MAYIPRRILQVERRHLRRTDDGSPDCLVIHFSYTDGDELFEAHSLEGAYPTKRFHLRSDLERWLRRRGYHD